MILLTDVATKLEELLNSYAPSDYLFVVKSAGYHLDSIANKKKSRNTIPVFISMIGGEYNPVPNLKQVNTTYEVNIYFPVRFKEDFYNLNTSLVNWFVGKKVTYGTDTALCNISVAEYGEIENLQFHQFEEWVMSEYGDNVHLFKNEHEINEPYMSMKFRLFATTLNTGFIFGNDVKYKLTATLPTRYDRIYVLTGPSVTRDFSRYTTGDVGGKCCWLHIALVNSMAIYADVGSATQINANTKFYSYDSETQTFSETTYKFQYTDYLFGTEANVTTTEELVWDQSGTGASISPISEQIVGVDKFARNVPNITNFNKSIVVYVKNTEFWQAFLHCYNAQRLDLIKNIKLTKTYYFNDREQMSEYYSQVLLSYNENVELGSPLSFTLTFGDGE